MEPPRHLNAERARQWRDLIRKLELIRAEKARRWEDVIAAYASEPPEASGRVSMGVREALARHNDVKTLESLLEGQLLDLTRD